MRVTRLLLVATLACAAVHAQDSRITAVTGVTLIDGTTRPPVKDAVIVIDGARISQVGVRSAVSIPAGATIIDGQGKFVIPGLADMHHHLLSGSPGGPPASAAVRSSLRRMLAVGVTTVFDPAVGLTDFAALKALSSSDAAPAARFFSAGPAVTVKGDPFGQGSPTPETVAEAQAAVRDLKAAGVDAIKVQRDDASWMVKQKFGLMKQEVLAALVAEAHQQGLKVYAHAPMLKEAREALRAGVDGLMHGILDAPVDPEFIDLMKRNRASYVPTMALFNDVADVAAWAKRLAPSWDRAALQPPRLYEFFTTPAGVQMSQMQMSNAAFVKEHLPTQKANLKAVFDAGVPVVLGTDTGFTGVLIGVSTQIELELMVEAGLTTADVLRAATINGARMIGREKEFGTLEAGKAADLVILDADPLADIRNVARIFRTFKGGVAYEPVDPARPLPPRGRGFAQ